MGRSYTDLGGAQRDSIGIFGPASIPSHATLTRPADTSAYTVGDLIANSITLASVLPLIFAVSAEKDVTALLRRVRIKANWAGAKGAVIRLHLFRNDPTANSGLGVADNGALNNAETYAVKEALYLGYADVTLSQLFSDNIAKGFASIDAIAEPASGTQNIYGLLESRSALTPTSSGQITVTLEALRD